MKKIILTIVAIVLSLSAYTIQLDGIGNVVIPDSICNIELADSITNAYNNYNYSQVLKSFKKQAEGAEFSATGNQVIAMYNFFNLGNFNVKLLVSEVSSNNTLGIYIPEYDVIVINIFTLHRLTRLKLFYILAHELAHNTQQEEKQLEGSFSLRLINEVYADLTAILCVKNFAGVDMKKIIPLRQSAELPFMYAGKDKETAKIIIGAIIDSQNSILNKK